MNLVKKSYENHLNLTVRKQKYDITSKKFMLPYPYLSFLSFVHLSISIYLHLILHLQILFRYSIHLLIAREFFYSFAYFMKFSYSSRFICFSQSFFVLIFLLFREFLPRLSCIFLHLSSITLPFLSITYLISYAPQMSFNPKISFCHSI